MFEYIKSKVGLGSTNEIDDKGLSSDSPIRPQSKEISVAKLKDEEGILYLVVADVDGVQFDSVAEELGQFWKQNMDDSELCILHGRYGDDDDDDYTIMETSLGDAFDTYCGSCSNEKLYNTVREEFYCPACN